MVGGFDELVVIGGEQQWQVQADQSSVAGCEFISGPSELSQEELSITSLADSLAEQLRAVERPFLDEEGSQRIVFIRRRLDHDLAPHPIDQLATMAAA